MLISPFVQLVLWHINCCIDGNCGFTRTRFQVLARISWYNNCVTEGRSIDPNTGAYKPLCHTTQYEYISTMQKENNISSKKKLTVVEKKGPLFLQIKEKCTCFKRDKGFGGRFFFANNVMVENRLFARSCIFTKFPPRISRVFGHPLFRTSEWVKFRDDITEAVEEASKDWGTAELMETSVPKKVTQTAHIVEQLRMRSADMDRNIDHLVETVRKVDNSICMLTRSTQEEFKVVHNKLNCLDSKFDVLFEYVRWVLANGRS